MRLNTSTSQNGFLFFTDCTPTNFSRRFRRARENLHGALLRE
jgi:hypothetical protein